MALRHDLHHYIFPDSNAGPRQIVPGQPTLLGKTIDLQNYNGIEFFITSGTITDGAPYTPVMYQFNNVDFSDAVQVPANQILGSIAGATFSSGDSNKTKSIGYIPSVYRYVRLDLQSTSPTTGAMFGTIYALSSPNVVPSQA